MQPRSMLLAQIDLLRQELAEVKDAVQSPKLDEYLRQQVGARFGQELAKVTKRVEDLRQQVANDQPLQASWATFRARDKESRKLFDECLSFIQGALLRAAGIGHGICLLADHLLDDLAAWADVGWNRFTLVATGEFYGDIAEIIRLRFPETSIWNLPVAGHEFGHFLGPELRENESGHFTYPFQEMLAKADETRLPEWALPHSQDWYHLHELFADVFATVTLGPAFACCLILLRLNPGDAYLEGPTHPTHARRVHALLWVLSRMDQAIAGLRRPYQPVVDLLRGTWCQGLEATGQAEGLKDAEAALLEERLKRLYALLLDHTPPELAYQFQDWLRAESLAATLQADPLPPAWQPDADLTRRDVLNAAWLARLSLKDASAYELRDLGKRAADVYRGIKPRERGAPTVPGP